MTEPTLSAIIHACESVATTVSPQFAVKLRAAARTLRAVQAQEQFAPLVTPKVYDRIERQTQEQLADEIKRIKTMLTQWASIGSENAKATIALIESLERTYTANPSLGDAWDDDGRSSDEVGRDGY